MDVTSHTQNGLPGSYSLRELISDVPLSENEDGIPAHITCVDAWEGNIYIGTSTGEVLHYFQIPPDPADPDGQPSYIFATKIEPEPTTASVATNDRGVRQILLLPKESKLCILCNGVLQFYTLPELSPGFDGRVIRQQGCLWVGGLDQNIYDEEEQRAPGTPIVMCLRQRLRLVNVGEQARKIRDIELPGVSAIARRGDLACVADGDSYSLLDVVNQRKQELFPISSSSLSQPVQTDLQAPVASRQASRSFSSATNPMRPSRGHDRNISLGGQPRSITHSRQDSNAQWPARGSSRLSLPPPGASPARTESPPKQDETSPSEPAKPPTPEPEKLKRPLPPNIVSPTPSEFLLTTGTQFHEPGVGMFVNLEGDLVPRGAMEFSSYPESLVLEGSTQATLAFGPNGVPPAEYVLAIVQKNIQGTLQKCVEIQRWDLDSGGSLPAKEWLVVGAAEDTAELSFVSQYGLRVATSPARLGGNGISTSLRLRRLLVKQTAENTSAADEKRNAEEDKIAARFEQLQANVLLYAKNKIMWVLRCPIIVQLDRQLERAIKEDEENEVVIDVSAVQQVVNNIRGQDPRDELEFLTLTYVRQKAALMLFGQLALQTSHGIIAKDHEKRRVEEALIAAEIDPRVVLTLVPPLDGEIAVGLEGIWLPQGIRDVVDALRRNLDPKDISQDPHGAYGANMLHVMRQYLFAWRKKKGFGSVADETHVFLTVDAALLRVLLLLDQDSARGPAAAGSIRAELNEIVDRGVDCFDRAVELFEQFNRIYMLSRLYQSRRMASNVLATWKRIIEGEEDTGGELIDGELQVRRYLTQIRDASLVKEYGAWLAKRNPKLGVQVFADDGSKTKFEPTEAVALLHERAPGAVKEYLEYLVFGKNHVQYVNDLIAYYLDSVLDALQKSQEIRNILAQSYETYRALTPPKPTYRQFVTDNAIDEDWWRNRLRLLQLIGGSHGAASKYDVRALEKRLEPYHNELVPEMIILNGRVGKHQEALRLLTHGLGDYDTAIRYCLLGGSSIFHPGSGFADFVPVLPTQEEQALLFGYLLHEFFQIEDFTERLERTAELLERFGGWFDVARVLELIPDSWSVELVSEFLVRAFRRLVQEKNETVIVKALCGAQNLRESVAMIEKVESVGPTFEGLPESAVDAA